MPIIDLSLVVATNHDVPQGTTQHVADRLGSALGSPPGRLWVRLHIIPSARYAENGAEVDVAELPAFVRILHSRPPTGTALAEEAARVCTAVAAALDRDSSRVHVEYAPPGAGRMAFGGKLVPGPAIPESYFILYVADQQRGRAFYEAVLAVPPRLDVPGMTEFALPSGGILGLMPEVGIKRLLGDELPDPAKAQGIPRAELYLIVANPDVYHARALAAGARELSPLQARPWGHAAAYALDPDGHVLAFSVPIA